MRSSVNINYNDISENADDILKNLQVIFKNGKVCLIKGFTTDYNEFRSWLNEDMNFKPLGNLIKKFNNSGNS